MPPADPEREPLGPPDEVESDEVILKRLPGPQPDYPATTIERPGIGLTATSFYLRPRPHEEYPSWSRQKLTSAETLLQLEADKGRDVSGWSVVAVRVEEVRSLGLEVAAKRTEEDPGHCQIVPTASQRFTDKKLWSKLAKRTKVVYTAP